MAQAGHETLGSVLTIELDRSCTLVGILRDGGDGEFVLRAVTEGYRLQEQDPSLLSGLGFDAGDHTWRAKFDVRGRAEIQGLLPNAPLRISVIKERTELIELAEPVTLRPGETRELELSASSTCRLSGIVRDDTSAVVPGLTVWLLRADASRRLYLASHESDERVATAKTDAEGRFTIEKVNAGTWRLGPEAKFRSQDADVDANEIAPVAMLLEIPPGETTHSVELVVHRGLTIRGRVLDPDDKPVPHAVVFAFAASTYVISNAREDGSFVVGPLPPASFSLHAECHPSTFAHSEEARADAGARDVVLHVRRAGKLSGRVVDAITGEGVVAQIAVSIPGDSKGFIYMPTSKPDGKFELDGLLPGTYAFAATLTDGRAGVLRGIELTGGADLRDFVVSVRQGAQVRVKYDGSQGFCSAQLLQDGVVVATDGVEKGTAKTFAVPAGSTNIRCRLGGNGKEVARELTLDVGELRELVITDED
jgi:hypothetical protein